MSEADSDQQSAFSKIFETHFLWLNADGEQL